MVELALGGIFALSAVAVAYANGWTWSWTVGLLALIAVGNALRGGYVIWRRRRRV